MGRQEPESYRSLQTRLQAQSARSLRRTNLVMTVLIILAVGATIVALYLA